jgi:hypothetical protein
MKRLFAAGYARTNAASIVFGDASGCIAIQRFGDAAWTALPIRIEGSEHGGQHLPNRNEAGAAEAGQRRMVERGLAVVGHGASLVSGCGVG